jgi:hypothetical protein
MHEHNAFNLPQINSTVAGMLSHKNGPLVSQHKKKIVARISVSLLPKLCQDDEVMSGRTVKRTVVRPHHVLCHKEGESFVIATKHELSLYEFIRSGK